MKFLSLILLLGFASPLKASGSWGGGTPPTYGGDPDPAEEITNELIKDEGNTDADMQVPRLGLELQFRGNTIDAIPTDELVEQDCRYWILLSQDDYEKVTAELVRKGELRAYSDTGTTLKFRDTDGHLEDSVTKTRIVPVSEFYGKD